MNIIGISYGYVAVVFVFLLVLVKQQVYVNIMKATNPYLSKIDITVLKTNQCSGKSLLERNEELAARNRAVAEQCQQKLEVAFFQYFVVDFSKGNTWPM